jgi:phosphate acetyltransferase
MSTEAVLENRTFDEIAIGETASLTHLLTKQELEGFAAVSGDCNPTHLDADYARAHGLREPVAHGLWTASLISNLLGNVLPGAGTTYVKQELAFHAPLFLGETATARVTVKAKHDDGCLVELDCLCTNERGDTVLTGKATVRAPRHKERLPAIVPPSFFVQTHDIYEDFLRRAKEIPPIPCAIAFPCDESSLRGAAEAVEAELLDPILVGPAARIGALASEHDIDITRMRIVDAPDAVAAARFAVAEVRAGRAELLMKGSLHSDELLAAVVARETGLRGRRRITHVFVMAVPSRAEPLFITDAAVNITPDLETKIDIVQNAIDLARGLGIAEPRVAVIAAVETVNPKMPATLEAAALAKMADRGQITGGLVDGPFAFDNAVSAAAAQVKGITSPVAGRANILVVPDIEAGNMLAKNLSFLAGADSAGIVLGAQVPIILTSRADSVRSRMASTAVAALYAHALRHPAGAAR